MTSDQYVDKLIKRPLSNKWNASEDVMRSALTGAVETAVGRIASAYDFPFVIGVTSIVTIADEDEYNLKGDNSNARDIINIRYGSDNKLLDKIDKEAADRKYSEADALTTVEEWIHIGEKNNFPLIQLIGIPLVAGTVILYRFRKKNILPNAIPNDFGWVVMLVAEAELFQSTLDNNLQRKAEKAINSMIDDYTRGGGEESPAPQDQEMISQNRRRKLGGIG